MTTLRLVLGAIAGFFTTGVVAASIDAAIRAVVPAAFPADAHATAGWLVVALAYSGLAAVAGGYVAALAAGSAAPRVTMTTGGLMVLTGAVVALGRPDTAPLWYQLVAVALVLPAVWLGVRLRGDAPSRRDRTRDSTSASAKLPGE
jgi:hypothetical protein